jgi:hypothetical protein
MNGESSGMSCRPLPSRRAPTHPVGTRSTLPSRVALAECLERRLCLAALSFSPPVDYLIGPKLGLDNPEDMTVGDFNGDGKADVALTTRESRVMVLLNKGDGTLGPGIPYSPVVALLAPSTLTVGDFNGDGKQDLAVSIYAKGTVSVLLNKGAGVFSAPVPYAAGVGPGQVVAADFNGDGKTDLAVNNFNGGVSVLLNKGAGTFAPAVAYPTGFLSSGLAVGDFDIDGKPDLVTHTPAPNGLDDDITILKNNGDGSFAAPESFARGQVGALLVGDFSGDHKADIAFDAHFSDKEVDFIRMLTSKGTGSFGPTISTSVPFVPFDPGPSAVADFDGDGHLDFAGVVTSSNVAVMLNKSGSGAFVASPEFTASQRVVQVASGDFNGDGKPDLVTADEGDGGPFGVHGTGRVTVLLNTTPAAVPLSVDSFTLVDADTDRDVMTLSDGATFDLSKLPRRLNVRANTSVKVGSAQIGIDGRNHLELAAPYALFYDLSADYAAGTFADGNHTITAKAYTGSNGTGIAGAANTIHIHVINQPPAALGAVTGIALFNIDTGKDIRTLKDFDTLDLAKLPPHLGIRSFTNGQVASVVYVVDAHVGVPATNALKLGQHTLTALPFTGANGTGTEGASAQLRLTIVRSALATKSLVQMTLVGSTWQVVPGGATGSFTYNPAGPQLDFTFDGQKLAAAQRYDLIYYPDPWPANGLAVLGSGVVDSGGALHLQGSAQPGSLPKPYDANFGSGAKIFLVLASDVDPVNQRMIGWHPDAPYLLSGTETDPVFFNQTR